MKLENNKLYISFHKPKGLVGYLIALRTLGKYSHCEFILNDYIYLSNPGGVKKKPYIAKKNEDIYIINIPFELEKFENEFKKINGKNYDYWAIFLSQLLELGIEHKNKYFCSELCIFILNQLLDNSLTYNLNSIKPAEFSPNKLFKYLKNMELIKVYIKI